MAGRSCAEGRERMMKNLIDLEIGDVFWAPDTEDWIFTVNEEPRVRCDGTISIHVTPSGNYPRQVTGEEYVVYPPKIKVEIVKGPRRSGIWTLVFVSGKEEWVRADTCRGRRIQPNAKLIADAPEILRLLHKLWIASEGHLRDFTDDCLVIDEVGDMLERHGL